MSQGQLARRINVDRAAITRWAGGNARPDLHSALQLQRVLGIAPEAWETSDERVARAQPFQAA
jgi:transcriptional regulator with XRE-family HTH domain